MDYLKTYNYFYNKTERVLEAFIKKELVKSCNEERNFTATINKINGIRFDSKQEKLLKILINISSESFKCFNERYRVYRGDNVDKLILRNECFEAFNNSLEKNKVDYSYNKYVANLAVYESLNRVGNRFRNYDDMYRLMYDLKDFKEFSLKEVKGGHKSCGLYDRLFLRRYPDHINQSDFNLEEIVLDKKEESIEKPKLTRIENGILNNINAYTDKEKFLLLYSVKYALENQLKISAIEFSRILYICKVDDLSLFHDNYKNNSSYNKISNGLKCLYTKRQDRIEAIRKLQTKNGILNFKDINLVLEHVLDEKVLMYQI